MLLLKQIDYFAKHIRQSSFAKNAGLLTLGTVVSQGISFAATPILSRLFSPVDYGLFALFVAVTGVVAALVTLSYPIRIMLPKSDAEARQVALVAVTCSIVAGFFLLTLTLVLPGSAFNFFGLSPLGAWLPVAISVGTVVALINTANSCLNRNAQYKRLTLLKITQTLIGTGCGLTMGVIGIEQGLIYAQTASVIIVFFLLVFLRSIKVEREDFQAVLPVALNHKSAPIHVYPVAVLDVVTMQLPIFLISLWFNVDLAGQYRMAYSVCSLPAALIGAAVGQVFYQRFSDVWPDAVKAKRLFYNTWRSLALLGFVPFCVLFIWGEYLFSFFFGPSWEVAGKIASILSIMAFFSLIHSPLSTAYLVLSMEKLAVILIIPVIFLRALSFFLGYIYNNILVGLYAFTLFEILNFFVFQFLMMKKIQRCCELQ